MTKKEVRNCGKWAEVNSSRKMSHLQRACGTQNGVSHVFAVDCVIFVEKITELRKSCYHLIVRESRTNKRLNRERFSAVTDRLPEKLVVLQFSLKTVKAN